MERPRRYSRISLLADVTIQPGEENPMRFAGRALNISRGGLAIYSRYYFPPAVLVAVELTVPLPEEGIHCVRLYGVIRWVRMESDGAMLGIELLADTKAGDFAWYNEHFDACVAAYGRKSGSGCRAAPAATEE
jgi:hypothetical protein